MQYIYQVVRVYIGMPSWRHSNMISSDGIDEAIAAIEAIPADNAETLREIYVNFGCTTAVRTIEKMESCAFVWPFSGQMPEEEQRKRRTFIALLEERRGEATRRMREVLTR